MSTVTEFIRFLVRGGLASALASLNETPLRRELIVALDARNLKVGDGSLAFNSIPWLLVPWAAGSGTNTITATFTAKPVYFDGLMVRVRAAGANTGAVTFNPNSLGALAVKKAGGTVLAANDIANADHELLLVYHDAGTPWWELVNPAPTPAAVAGSGITLLGTATVAGAAATTLTLSGLNLSAYKAFLVTFALDNATGSDANVSLYFNADTTAANYYRQSLNADNGTITAARANTAQVGTIPANETLSGSVEIMNDRDGRPRATARSNRDAASAIKLSLFITAWTSATNVTGITLSSSVASALAIGSNFNVYGIS